MNYRLYKPDDFEKVDALLKKNNIPFPSDNQILVVAEDNQGEIVSACGLKKEWNLEPLVGTNPISIVNLVRMIEGIALSQGMTKLYAEIPKDNEKHLNQAEKDGWVIVSNNRIKLEKYYG